MSQLVQFPKISTFAILALNFILGHSQSAQAAEFSFDYGGFGGGGSGYLLFDVSPLKGIGTETISLSELVSYAQNQSSTLPSFDYSFTGFNPIASSIDGQYYVTFSGGMPVFTFESGDITGIELNADSINLPSVTNQYNTPYFHSSISGTYSFALNGDTYKTKLDTTITSVTTDYIPILDEDGNPIEWQEVSTTETAYNSYDPYDSGDINFTTITPISTAVPEPLTMLGVGTAFGFGLFFKQALKRKQKPE